MKILFILSILLICTIIFTAIKIRSGHKKELADIFQILNERKRLSEE